MKKDYQFKAVNGKLQCSFEKLVPKNANGTFYLLCLSAEEYKKLNRLNSLMDKFNDLQNQIEEQPTFGYDILYKRHEQKILDFMKQNLTKKEEK